MEKIKWLLLSIFLVYLHSLARAQFTPSDSANLNSWLQIITKSVKSAEKGTFKYSNLAFNAADLYAIKNNKDSTFFYLEDAINTCPDTNARCAEAYLPDVLGTCFFEKWHNTVEWKNFEKRMTAGFYKRYGHLKNPRLAFDLIKAKGADQTARYYFFIIKSDRTYRSVWNRIDSANLVLIRNVIDKYGYPSLSMVGEEASNAAFLLCQHADNDLAFQKKVLGQMEVLIKKKEVPAKDYAYLADRVMVAEKGVQLYGTQFKNRYSLYPVLDSNHVDERRKVLGLSTLAEYKNSFQFFGD